MSKFGIKNNFNLDIIKGPVRSLQNKMMIYSFLRD